MFAKQESVKILRTSAVEGLEFFRGKDTVVSKHRHFHREFQIAVVERGALDFKTQGVRQLAQPGDLMVCNSGEVHEAQSFGELGWSFWMIYTAPSLIAETVSEITEGNSVLPHFKPFDRPNRNLGISLQGLYQAMQNSQSPLEQQTCLLNILSQLIINHSIDAPKLKPIGRENLAVKRVREYLHENLTDNVTLDKLSKIACLSKFHLVRVFKQHTGLPPHAFQTQIRVNHARNLLARGKSLASAAYEAGFTHESHLIRHFTRVVSFTPGRYQKNSKNVQHKNLPFG